MSDERSRQRLGRGLASLIGTGGAQLRPIQGGRTEQPAAEAPSVAPDREVALERLHANPNNPRRHFDEAEIADLAASIRKHGIVQPLLVRPDPEREGDFEIVAGERRFRAAKLAGLAAVPVVTRDIDDRQSIEVALIENVQRTDLNAIEEALAYERLIDEHGYTQADLAEGLGKSRSHVANTLRLLKLPESVKGMVEDGRLTPGAARTLVTSADPERVAEAIVKDGLSVRQAEELARETAAAGEEPAQASAPGPNRTAAPRVDMSEVERRLAEHLGASVSVKAKGATGQKGTIRIDYASRAELDAILERLQAAS